MALLKLKNWRGNVLVSEAGGATSRSLVLGGNLDYGGNGTVTVTSIEYDTDARVLWYTLTPRNPGINPIRLMMISDGVGEPLEAQAEAPKAQAKK